jgi:hypothetical protein
MQAVQAVGTGWGWDFGMGLGGVVKNFAGVDSEGSSLLPN